VKIKIHNFLFAAAFCLALCGQAAADPLITLQPQSILNLLLGDNATFSVGATSTVTTNLQYQWFKNGVRIPDATNSTYTVSNTLGIDCGSFTVRVGDGVGVVESASADLTANIISLLGGILENALSLTNGQVRSSNVGAVKGAGEPDIVPGDPGGSAVWYKWTPLVSGVVTFTTEGSDFDTLLGVYTGSAPGNLVTVPSAINNDDAQNGYLCSTISFNCSALTTYLLTVDGYYGAQGNIVLTWDVTIGDSLPSATATPLTVITPQAAAVKLPTPWPGEDCDWLLNGVVVAAQTNAMTLTNLNDDTVGSYIARYTTQDGSESFALPTSLQESTLQDGSTATNSIAWNKFLASASSPFIPPTPGKLKMDGGGDTRGYSVAQVYSTKSYSDEPGEPIICNQNGGNPGWYTYVTPASGSLLITTTGSTFNTILGVYVGNGDSFATLTNVGCGYTTNYMVDGQPAVYIPNVPANQTNYIVVEGENGASGTVHLNVSLGDPVSIDVAPTNQSAGPGTNVLLAVSASGATPLSYLWQLNGTNIPGATNGTLVITNMDVSSTGSYTVVVSNLVSLMATQAVVSLVMPPSITTQPSSQAVCVNSNVTFTCAAAGGEPLAFQWQCCGTNCASATDNSLTLTSAQMCNAGNYRCIVTNLTGVVTSFVATLTVTQAIPLVTWPAPALISYGTALGAVQLNATAGVPGSFTYTPASGTVLTAGAQSLSVVFTPADALGYSSVTDTVSLAVMQAPLTVTAASASRVYGAANPAFTGTITGLVAGDNITATYNCGATTSSPVGPYAIVPSLVDPNNRQTNYTLSLVNGALTVNQAAPTLTWTNPAPIIYGAALTSNELNAIANVPGACVFNPTNAAVLDAGTNTLSVIFTPADTADYAGTTNSVTLVVTPALLTVIAGNASRPYGAANPVFTGTFVGLTNGDDITALYNCGAAPNSPVQSYAITPTLVDPNSRASNYTVSLVQGTLTVTQAVPLVTWANPAPVPYGAPLSSNQLNATANVPGSFAYTPDSGAALTAGTNTLSVTFTPADTLDYSSATNTVNLLVNSAPAFQLSIDASGLSTSGAVLTMPAIPGQSYQVQVSSNLTDWVVMTNIIADPSGTIQVSDVAAMDCTQRFYRAVTQ
jgi:hypothetical protein